MRADYEDGTYVISITLDSGYIVGCKAIEMTGEELESSNDTLRNGLSDPDSVFEFEMFDGFAIIPTRSIRWINRIRVG